VDGGLRRILARVAPLAVVVIATACGQAAGAAGRQAQAPAAAHPVAMHPVRLVGGSAAQRRLLRRILALARPTAITRITIAPPDRGWHPFRPGDVMLTIDVTGSRNPRREDLLAEWQGWVVAGAFRDRSAETGLPRVIALDEHVGGRFAGGMRIALRHAVDGDATRAQAEAHRARLRRIAGRSGARLLQLRVARPDGLAATVIVQTDRPAWYLKHRMPAVLRETADRYHDDGLAWAVYDRAGRRVFQMANASRLATGAEGTIPGLAGCNPFGPGDVVVIGGTPPPTCPA
jgi:hypothetical protein